MRMHRFHITAFDGQCGRIITCATGFNKWKHAGLRENLGAISPAGNGAGRDRSGRLDVRGAVDSVPECGAIVGRAARFPGRGARPGGSRVRVGARGGAHRLEGRTGGRRFIGAARPGPGQRSSADSPTRRSGPSSRRAPGPVRAGPGPGCATSPALAPRRGATRRRRPPQR